MHYIGSYCEVHKLISIKFHVSLTQKNILNIVYIKKKKK